MGTVRDTVSNRGVTDVHQYLANRVFDKRENIIHPARPHQPVDGFSVAQTSQQSLPTGTWAVSKAEPQPPLSSGLRNIINTPNEVICYPSIKIKEKNENVYASHR